MNASHSIKAIIYFLVLAALMVKAPTRATAQQPTFRHISLQQGLAHRRVMHLLQDHYGFMWVATQNGLCYWDGYSFKVFEHTPNDTTTLSSNVVQTIFEDSKKRLWIGTRSGFNLFNREKGTFTRFKCPLNNDVQAFEETPDGKLWVGTDYDGIQLFDPEKETITTLKLSDDTPANRVITLFKDSQSRLWIGTYGGLCLFNIDKQKVERFYVHEESDATTISSNWIYSIIEDRKGDLWFGTLMGMNKYNETTRSFTRFWLTHKHDREEVGQPAVSVPWIVSLFEDSRGQFWVGTYDGGLHQFDSNTGNCVEFLNDPRDPSSLCSNFVDFLTEDRSGQLWIATITNGISTLPVRPNPVTTFQNNPRDPFSLTNNNIESVFEDHNGLIWIGTSNGLNCYDPQTKLLNRWKDEPGIGKDGVSNFTFTIMEDQQQNLWFGLNGGGVFRYSLRDQSSTHYLHDPKDSTSVSIDQVASIVEADEHRLWIGTIGGGLNILDKRTGKFKRYPFGTNTSESLINDAVRSMIKDRSGRLWIVTRKGVSVMQKDERTFIHHEYKSGGSLTTNSNTFVKQDSRGRIWIGSANGLLLYDEPAAKFNVIKKEDGLPGNIVVGMLEDTQGRLWLSMNEGIVAYTPAEKPGPGNWGTFSQFEAKGTTDFGGAVAKGSDGRFYVGGVNGLNVFNPDSLKPDPFVPPVVITGLEILNQPIIPGHRYGNFELEKAITYMKELTLTHEESVFSLEFASLAFENPERNKYAYKLEGFDPNWNYTTADRRFARYTNLDPGTYQFRVKGSNKDGVWNEQGASLTVVILPPWWETWWFKGVLAAIVMGIIVIIFFARVRRIVEMNALVAQHQNDLLRSSLQAQEEERKRIAQDLHDELGAVLSISRMQLVQLEQNQENQPLKAGLQRVRETTESALATMRRLSHELMPPQLESFGFVKTLEAVCAQVNSVKEIEITFLAEGQLTRWASELEVALYRICMELIHNTIKHARAKRIRIELTQNEKQLSLKYFDDGIGISANDGRGLGLKNMEARINAVGGTLKIANSPTGGFTATIQVPLITN